MVRSEKPTPVIHQRPRRSPVLIAAAALLLLAGIVLAGALHAHTGDPARVKGALTAARTVTLTTTVAAPATPVTTPPKPVPPARASGPSDLNTQGYRLMLAGNYAAALPLLRQAVAGALDPANPVTAYETSTSAKDTVKLGQCAAAMPYLQRGTSPARPPGSPRRNRLRPTPRQATSPADERRATLPRPTRSRQRERQSGRLRRSCQSAETRGRPEFSARSKTLPTFYANYSTA